MVLTEDQWISFRYDEIDRLYIDLDSKESLAPYTLRISSNSRPFSMLMDHFIRIDPGFLSKEDFIGICESLNSRVLKGQVRGEELHPNPATALSINIFGKPNEILHTTLEEKYASKDLGERTEDS